MAGLWRNSVWLAYGLRSFGKSGYEKAKKAGVISEETLLHASDDPSKVKVVAISGANSGLGKATALKIAQLGHEVHMLCRSEDKAIQARDELIEESKNKNIFTHIVDVSRPSSILSFAESFIREIPRLDVLVNNAGVMIEKRSLTDDGIESTFATNTLGTFLLTQTLLPLLAKSGTAEEPARVVIVSSGGMLTQKMNVKDWQYEHNYDGTFAYAQTKRHQAYLTELFRKKNKDLPVNFFSMHPGWADTPGVQTSMPSFYDKFKGMLRDSDQGADTIVWLGVGTNEELKHPKSEDGQFYFDRQLAREHLPLCGTQSDEKDKHLLWEECLKLTKWSEEEEKRFASLVSGSNERSPSAEQVEVAEEEDGIDSDKKDSSKDNDSKDDSQ